MMVALRLSLLEQQIVEIVQRQVVQREAAAPGFRERGLQQHQHRQENRQRADEQRIAEHHPAPGPERDHPPLAALAGDRGVAPAAQMRRCSQNISTVMASSGIA